MAKSWHNLLLHEFHSIFVNLVISVQRMCQRSDKNLKYIVFEYLSVCEDSWREIFLIILGPATNEIESNYFFGSMTKLFINRRIPNET